MMMKKRFLLLIITFIFIISLTACGKKNGNDNENQENIGGSEETDPNVTDSKASELYFLNYDTDLDEQYQNIAAAYEEETGVKLNIISPSQSSYSSTLNNQLNSDPAPVIIELDSSGFETYGDRLSDLSATTLYSHLSDQGLSLTDNSGDENSGIYGIPYHVEGFGIIVNNAIMEKYIALESKATGITSIDEITNFQTLKAVVEDMQANKTALGIDGVFASISFAQDEASRWSSQLSSIPFHYEFFDMNKDASTTSTGQGASSIELSYGSNFRDVFDLYINNNVSKTNEFETKTEEDSITEFATGRCVMLPHGSWIWSEITKIEGNVVTEDDVRMLPIYIGAGEENKQGLAVGTHRYLAINDDASDEEKEAGVNFLEWLFTSEAGKSFALNDLGLNPPFDTFDEEEQPTDPLRKEVNRWLRTDKESTEWTFQGFPSQSFTTGLGSELLAYAKGENDWDTFTGNVTDLWSSEYGNQQIGGSAGSGGSGGSDGSTGSSSGGSGSGEQDNTSGTITPAPGN